MISAFFYIRINRSKQFDHNEKYNYHPYSIHNFMRVLPGQKRPRRTIKYKS